MCGIVGWSNLKNNIRDYSNIMDKMIDTLKFRGPDSGGLKIYNHALIGHRRLAIVEIGRASCRERVVRLV